MAAAATGSSSPPFELKSASLSVVALLLRTGDLDHLAAAMAEEFGDPPRLFDHDPVVVDLSQLGGDAPELDFTALAELLRRQRLLPVGVRGGSQSQHAAALAAGLAEAAAVHATAATTRPRRVDAVVPAAALAAAVTPVPVDSPSMAVPAAPPRFALPAPPTEPAVADHASASGAEPTSPEPGPAPVTLTIDKPLRSGQQVYAKGGDLIVLAAVNFGAEVLADGNIHVYGPLRGKAVAGAKGNADARIFSTCMEPELVAIAGTYRTTENPLPAEVVGKPAQIRLAGDRLVFEPLA